MNNRNMPNRPRIPPNAPVHRIQPEKGPKIHNSLNEIVTHQSHHRPIREYSPESPHCSTFFITQLPFHSSSSHLFFFIYLLLQLPLHYNSSSSWYDSANDPSRLTPQEWQNRSDQVSKMQQDLQTIETKMENVKEGQDGLQGEVKSLRRRLEKIRKMREEREEWMRKQLELKIKEAEQIRLEKVQLATNGVANTGPIATISMAKALAVATFVGGGKEISQDESKKSY
mmetsp:Transcript_8507/g.17734  ORF Transcript_8507/g.17734 Transcript_8507/m.17734 type:complete len:227 (+) Transcript_8507:177-857(+)